MSSLSINALAVGIFVVVSLKFYRTYFAAAAVFGLLSCGYQYTTWAYHSSASVADALYWVSLQTSFAVAIIPFYFLTLASWSDWPGTRRIFFILLGTAALAILTNALLPNTLRFDSVEQLVSVVVSEQFAYAHLVAKQSVAGLGLHLFGLFMVASLLLCNYRMYQKNKMALALALTVILLIQLLSIGWASAIDAGSVDGLYLAGFVFTALNVVVCVHVAYSLGIFKQRFEQRSEDKKQLTNVINQLAKGFRSEDEDSFYFEMLASLYSISKADLIFLATVSDDSPPLVQTRVALSQGVPTDNFEYTIDNTPCERILEEASTIYTQSIQQDFPSANTSLSQFTAYIGTPIKLGGKVTGLFVLASRTPLPFSNKLVEALEIFATRASAEMHRFQIEHRLRDLAYLDYTTQLPNQAKLIETIHQSYQFDVQSHSNTILLLIDLDRFTEINRQIGYDAGEYVLQELGKRFRLYASENVFFARKAGDEFAVVIQSNDTPPEETLDLHWEAIRAVVKHPICFKDREIRLDFSAGAVIFPQQTHTNLDVIRGAEIALRQSKTEGRGRLQVFDPTLLKALDSQRKLERMLRTAIQKNQQLSLVYQPKVDIEGQCKGAEALLRWEHPNDGSISPEEFIPVAESSGLIVLLGERVIEEVCKQIRNWLNQGWLGECKIAINIASQQLADDEFKPKLLATLNQYQIHPNQIELEVTESSLLHDIQGTVAKLKALQQEGFTIALDDFGTGYSSLSYLQELPLDVLKIDKSFVEKLTNQSASELISSIIAIGLNMDLQVVAEGTETESQVTALANMKCSLFQGYHFGRPMPAEEFANWYQRTNAVH
ncbi:putative bifunctional diguanylate cyclase/phosphodiesterase [Alteromonas aestuariivivens]|nr:GGDEF domain-containing protein [Alteromonas aestuariivivens]